MHHVAVFISHSWTYSEHYDTLADWIFNKRWKSNDAPIVFSDVSVPKNDPIHYAPTDKDLYYAISQRIIQANVVVIPTGMYANYSKWIKKEIDGAIALGRPILAVNPWAQERKSSIVAQSADRTVGWNINSVVEGIWHLRNG